jgi:hypothetical protein
VLIGLIVVPWLAAIGLVFWWAPEGWKFYGSLFFVGLGLVLTLVTPLANARDDRRPKLGRALFVAAIATNLVFAYALAAWCVSNCPYGLLAGLLTVVVWGALLALAARHFCRVRWDELVSWSGQALGGISPGERDYLYRGLFVGLVVAVLLLVVPIWPALDSPAHLAMFLLFGFVALYGIFTYLVRRSLVVVLLAVALLTTVSHIQPYQMRLAALSYDHSNILDLEKQIPEDVARQAKFDDLFREYSENEKRIKELNGDIRTCCLRLESENQPDVVAETRSKLESSQKELQRRETERQRLIAGAQSAWQEMERDNRVRAARLDARLRKENAQLRLDELSGGKPALLRVQDLAFMPRSADMDEPEPLVVIAISGGGIRAAVWAFHVLTRLELEFANKGIDFPAHVRIITGASGGMLGASYYVTTLPTPQQRHIGDEQWRDQRGQILGKQQHRLESSDYLTPLSQRLVFNDIPGWLSPWPARLDRGQALEKAWHFYLKQDPDAAPGSSGTAALDVTFAELREDERTGRRPSLVFTPMMIEDGRRLLVSNLDLRWVISNDGYAIPSGPPPGEGTPASPGKARAEQYGVNHSIEALELFRLFPPAQEKLTVATAVRMSASFSYFSPAVSLPTSPRRRVVDAGYYDNYGVSLTAAWLLSEENQEWIKSKSGRRILFIQIRDGVTEEKRQLRKAQVDKSDSVTRSGEEMTSPIEAMSNARVSSCSFRNDGQLKLLAQTEKLRDQLSAAVSRQGDPGLTYDTVPFMVANFECEAEASLSWYLSKREQSDIAGAAKKIDDKIDRIINWWEKKDLMDFPAPVTK